MKSIVSSGWVRLPSTFLVSAVIVLADDPLVRAAGTVSADAMLVTRAVGGALIGGGGITLLMDHNHGVGTKVTSMAVGAVIAFLAPAIATFVQGL